MPPRLTAQDFDQELLILFDAYVHGSLDRRGFLAKAQKFATAGITAVGLLAALSPNFAAGQQVPQDDARLRSERPSVPSPAGNGSVKGYLARPASAGTARLPAVLVIHENRGLNPHIEDIARRLALDSFMAFAPDALTPLGGYPGDEEKARTLFATLNQSKAIEDFLAASQWLKSRPDATGRLGAVGFCYGGGIVHQLAVRLPDLGAAITLSLTGWASGAQASGRSADALPLPATLVIGHRGASALRPEHTLEAYAQAIDDGADAIEPDLVSTRDGVLVARHENEISGTTNVADKPEFAARQATRLIDNVSTTGWFTEDFTLAELQTLRARERIPLNRPASTALNDRLMVPTLQAVIDLAKTRTRETGRTIAIYPEVKHPGYFRSVGLPLVRRACSCTPTPFARKTRSCRLNCAGAMPHRRANRATWPARSAPFCAPASMAFSPTTRPPAARRSMPSPVAERLPWRTDQAAGLAW